jgi:opacity protein-like surface antigen
MNARRIALLVTAAAATFAGQANAQRLPSRFQVSLYPSSRVIATRGDSDAQPTFKSYTPGGSLTVAFTPYFAVEGDVSASRGNVQALGPLGRMRSPALFAATANAVVTLAPHRRVQPYLTVGVGAIQLFKRAELGMTHGETLESANAGGGVKVMFRGWGVRVDYRYVGMDSTSEQRSTFFGPTTRHAHRVAVGLIIGQGR